MQRITGWFFVVLFFGGLFAFGWLFSTAAESVLDPLLPGDWQKRLVDGLLVAGVMYLLWQIEDLKRDLRSLNAHVDRLTERINRSGKF